MEVPDLTLTSVVFEFSSPGDHGAPCVFNFNKCCIWIPINGEVEGNKLDLTLTSVVFE